MKTQDVTRFTVPPIEGIQDHQANLVRTPYIQQY